MEVSLSLSLHRFLPFEVREKCVPCFAIQVKEQVDFPLPPFTV